jgi:hypothetical protein
MFRSNRSLLQALSHCDERGKAEILIVVGVCYIRPLRRVRRLVTPKRRYYFTISARCLPQKDSATGTLGVFTAENSS